MEKSHVLQATDVASYSPANHTGTSNQRIISRDSVGAQYLEVLIGTISKGHGALKHAHPSLEQASLVLQGSGISEVGGVERSTVIGEWGFNPEGVFHRFTVTSEDPVKVVVVYAPPYQENPQAAVVFDENNPQDAVQVLTFSTPFAAEFQLPHQEKITYRPVITRETVGARHMEIFEVKAEAHASVDLNTLCDTEMVICIREGSLTGCIGTQVFEASVGDWIFIPEGMAHEYRNPSPRETTYYVIKAFKDPLRKKGMPMKN